MGGRKIANVDVVSNACSIRSRKICSVNFGMRQLAERDLKNARNQMRLGSMMLPIFFRSTCNVEIAQRYKRQSMNLIKPSKDLFEHKLRFSIWIDRILWRFLIDRHSIRRSESCAG